jgi:DNA polymerase III delta prime subunit
MKTTHTFITKYKPYFIKDFHFDSDFSTALKTLFDIDDLNLLFVGEPNSGKTTFLYAIIREYYQLSKTDPIPESNILFINNIKEQGIQFFRNEMKTFCRSHSNIYGKKKLIIIDDIDMINEQSQQVFRNYIDKYNHNVNFISVCTNIQKIIESIQSRINIIHIPSLNDEQMRNIMNKIIEKEEINMDNESKDYLILISNHYIRNVINNLEKIHILDIPITIDICKNLCSNISFLQFEEYIRCILLKNNIGIKQAMSILYSIHDYGYSVIDILDYFFNFIKITNLISEDQKYRIIPIICNYTTIFHNIHEDSIELALFTKDLFKILS